MTLFYGVRKPRPYGFRAPRWPFQINRASWQARDLEICIPFLSFDVARPFDLGRRNGIRWAQTGTPGRVGHGFFSDVAADFGAGGEGAGDAWYYSRTDTWPGDPITISYWSFVPAAVASSAFSLSDGDNINRIQAHAPWSDSVLYWDYGTATAGQGRISTSYAAYIGAWTHVALIGSNGLHAIYLNGRLITSNTSTSVPTFTSTMKIGSFFDGIVTNFYHNGDIKDFRAYRRVLTAAEVWSLYAPQTRWDLYEEIGATLYSFPEAAGAPPAEVVGRGRLLSHERNRLVIH